VDVPLQETGVRREHDQRLRAGQRFDGQSAIGGVHTPSASETDYPSGSVERQSDVRGEVRGLLVAGKT